MGDDIIQQIVARMPSAKSGHKEQLLADIKELIRRKRDYAEFYGKNRDKLKNKKSGFEAAAKAAEKFADRLEDLPPGAVATLHLSGDRDAISDLRQNARNIRSIGRAYFENLPKNKAQWLEDSSLDVIELARIHCDSSGKFKSVDVEAVASLIADDVLDKDFFSDKSVRSKRAQKAIANAKSNISKARKAKLT